jgi:hypothetical protein
MALESSVKGLLPLASVACPVEMLDDEHFETFHSLSKESLSSVVLHERCLRSDVTANDPLM